jgi:hypothetical protein
MSRNESNVARALTETLSSPNVSDANGECANVTDTLAQIARSIHHLAEATKAGPGPSAPPSQDSILVGAQMIGGALQNIAEALVGLTEELHEQNTYLVRLLPKAKGLPKVPE